MDENKTNPTAHLYVQSWIGKRNIEQNVLKIEEELLKYKQKYTVINSTNNVYNKENWIDSGDHWYNVSFYTALQDFDMQSDYFVFITGDVVVDSWEIALDRMYSVLDNEIGSYCPISLVGDRQETYSKLYSSIKDVDSSLYCTVIQDGIFIAIRKDVALILLDFFDYIANNDSVYDYKYGWGIDFAISAICLQEKLLLIKDASSLVYNTSVETELNSVHMKADVERAKILHLLRSFYLEKGVDIEMLINKIKQRVGFLVYPKAEPDLSMTFQDFYE
jgi:hypothetical protein